MALLVVSSDLPEVLALADRIVVMADGRTVGELAGDGGDRGGGAPARDPLHLARREPLHEQTMTEAIDATEATRPWPSAGGAARRCAAARRPPRSPNCAS